MDPSLFLLGPPQNWPLLMPTLLIFGPQAKKNAFECKKIAGFGEKSTTNFLKRFLSLQEPSHKK
jgi:hypothetical protein